MGNVQDRRAIRVDHDRMLEHIQKAHYVPDFGLEYAVELEKPTYRLT
jgi:hypothetical protein